MQQSKTVLGLMSGTSLDGVDAALCSFTYTGSEWNYDLLYSETIAYTESWKKKLSAAFGMSGRDLTKLDVEYGMYLGYLSRTALNKAGIKADLISSHGHTVFHDPANSYTLQIGNGANIASESGIPVVSNFRVTDVAARGQGAPLVPVGDVCLFDQYQACLNLGGFANISFDNNNQRIAFDICPVNIILNHLSKNSGSEYDKDGTLGRKGNSIYSLLTDLNSISYYRQDIPKSLGREWFEGEFLPLINKDKNTIYDKLRTVYQHIAHQLVVVFKKYGLQQVLVTGGGTHNKLLMELIKQETGIDIVIPDTEIINFKEAIIFAFLGLLRALNKINCFSSVTGALKDTSCGTLFFP